MAGSWALEGGDEVGGGDDEGGAVLPERLEGVVAGDEGAGVPVVGECQEEAVVGALALGVGLAQRDA